MRKRSPEALLADLLRAAARARENAHAPYSQFPVGAAVLAEGRIYAGCNVENSAYPLSICAERNAVAAAVSAGARRIEAVAVVGGQARPAAPCGGCRQVLAEFCAPGAPVVYSNALGERIATTVGELLPSAFSAVDLAPIAAEPESIGSARGRSRAAPGTSRSAARRRGTRSSGR